MLSEPGLRQAKVRVKALLNANRKKSVHISLFAQTHKDFKKTTVSRDLSMQEVFEHLASLVADDHPVLTKILDDYVLSKREMKVQQLEAKYTENLYDVIGDDTPFGEE